MESYLKNRKQCVKIGPFSSKWQNMLKGIPQWSILVPILEVYLRLECLVYLQDLITITNFILLF